MKKIILTLAIVAAFGVSLLAEDAKSYQVTGPVLEVNASHPLVQALAKKFAAGPDKGLVEDAAWLIYEEARLADGDTLSDAPAFAARLRRVLEKAFA